LPKSQVNVPHLEKLVGIDGRSLEAGAGGVATYVAGLVRHLPFLDPIRTRIPANNLLWNLLRVPAAAALRKWKLFHAPSYTCPLLSPCPVVLSVHDISYLVRDEWYPYRTGTIRKAYYRASLKRADRILVPSRFTRKEVVRLFPGAETRLRVVPLAVSKSLFFLDPAGAVRVREKFRLPEQFILHVGDLHPRRNIDILDRITPTTGLPLVLVGRPLHPVPVRKDVIRLEAISVEDLRGCYSAATLMVYPSVYEGFGLPLLEAMACGLPVVASDRASIPEVCGNAAVLVEPTETALLRGIEEAIHRRDHLVRAGTERAASFSWFETARKTRKVYEELI